jgi:sugar-specific transcriptional regulator TrmB
MANELDALQGIGLSQNESRLYLLLIQHGPMRATALAAKSGLHRRSVYDTMELLEKKGMAGKSDISGVLVFSPSPPSALKAFLDEKNDAMEKMLPGLSKSFESEERTLSSVMYGISGIKTVLEDVLTLKADYCVYQGQLQIFDYLPKFFPIFNEKRKRLGIRARYILLDTQKARERSKQVPLAEFRFMDPGESSIGVWWTYADRLVLFVLRQEPITIMIKSADLAKTFRESFDSMFGSKSRVYRGKEGMMAIFERTLECPETVFIGSTGAASVLYWDYFEKSYIPRAIAKGHNWRSVAHRCLLKTRSAKMPFHFYRFLPKDMEPNPNVVWIFGDCVANILWLAEPVAFLVEDKNVANAYRGYFELLWKIAGKGANAR